MESAAARPPARARPSPPRGVGCASGVPGSLVGVGLPDPMFMAPADPTNVTVACSGVTRRTKALLFFGFAFAVMADPVSSVAYAIEAALRALHGHLGLLLPTMGIVIGIIGLVTLITGKLRWPHGSRRGADVVRPRRPADLRHDDVVVHHRCCGCAACRWISPHAATGQAPISGSASPALVAVILAFPVAMALATGTEAPATSIAPARSTRQRRQSLVRPRHVRC